MEWYKWTMGRLFLLEEQVVHKNETNSSTKEYAGFPILDFLLNPARIQEKVALIGEKRKGAENYFKGSNMKTLCSKFSGDRRL